MDNLATSRAPTFMSLLVLVPPITSPPWPVETSLRPPHPPRGTRGPWGLLLVGAARQRPVIYQPALGGQASGRRPCNGWRETDSQLWKGGALRVCICFCFQTRSSTSLRTASIILWSWCRGF